MEYVKQNFKRVFIVFVFISCVHSSEDQINQEVYDSVTVAFYDDPCDKREIEVPDFNAPGRRISEQKCLEYIWRIRYLQGKVINAIECAIQKHGIDTIIGGRDVIPGEFAHMGAIGWKAKLGTWIFKCGGSLISEKFVLTAAHCCRVTKNDATVVGVEPKIVRLGSQSILDTVNGQPAYDIGISKFIKHHHYDPNQLYNDIALVELDKEVPFHWEVHPSCLWPKFDNPEKGTLAGWGVIDTSSLETSPRLLKAEVKILESKKCNKSLKSRKNRKWRGIVSHQLCAGVKTGKVDSCQGDSGGPLQSKILMRTNGFRKFVWDLQHIVGVTSFGFGCARKNTPSIYTRVASFTEWIEDIVWPQNNITKSKVEDEDRFIFVT